MFESMNCLSCCIFAFVVVNWTWQASGQEMESYFDYAIHSPKCLSLGADYCSLADLYIQTMMKSVSGVLLETPAYKPGTVVKSNVTQLQFNPVTRKFGGDWPVYGVTMAGQLRLQNVYAQLLRILSHDIEGDFLEAGVWRGGSSIVAKAVLRAFEGKNRKVNVVDSFQGLPPPRQQFQRTEGNHFSKMTYLQVSLEQVQSNFERYGLLDDDVQFHKGFFNESLSRFRKDNPSAKIAFLRMDGDMYESTTDILYNVYEFVPLRGTVVVDDWNIPTARNAFMDFFKHHNVPQKQMIKVDGRGYYMIKTKEFAVDYQYYLDKFVTKK